MSSYKCQFLKIILLSLVLATTMGCNEQSLKRSYKVGSCLQETLRMVASSSPDRNMVYQVKDYKSNSYVLYLRFDKQWWYYRTIHEDQLLAREFEKIKCPDYSNKAFKISS